MTTTDMARVVATNVLQLEADSIELKELIAFISLPASMLKPVVGGGEWLYSSDEFQAASSTLYGLFSGIRRKNYHIIEQAVKRTEGGRVKA